MNSNTPYRGLLDSSNFPRSGNNQKQNFQSFKQKKYKQIDDAKGMKQSFNQRKSILKPTTLNLRNLAPPVQNGPPTFDSQYEFRNFLVNDPPHHDESKSEQMQYNLRLNSLTKQYQTKIKAQSQRYQLQILKLNQKIQSLKQISFHYNESIEKKAAEIQYCHLCSNGEVISRINKMMKQLQQTHQNCIKNQNESSKKIIILQNTVSNYREQINKLLSQKTILSSKINTLQEQNKYLNDSLTSERQRKKELETQKIQLINQHHKNVKFEQQRVNMKSGIPNSSERASINIKTRPSSSNIIQQTGKRSSLNGFFFDEYRSRKPTITETYQSEHASKIIDRVKSNSLMTIGMMNPRTKITQQKKYNYA